MRYRATTKCLAFEGDVCIASGDLEQVVAKVKSARDLSERGTILIFDGVSSEVIEIDFRGTLEEVLERLERDSQPPEASEEPARNESRGRGRPKLGVVAREVTLLPRHWEWLATQPGGASVALRKLVEAARRGGDARDRLRLAQESAYRFLSTMAGNLEGFEEATRALFANHGERFQEHIRSWPPDIRDQARRLAAEAIPDMVGT